jgi:hypothetical protein
MNSQVCRIASGGILDNLVLSFYQTMHQYSYQTTNLANKIFITLFALEFLWQLTINKIFIGDLEKLWVFFFVRSALGLFFAKYLVNIDFYRGIIAFVAKFAAQIGGFDINFEDGMSSIFAGITPSTLISYFSCIADVVHQGADSTGVVSYITIKIMLAISLLLFFLVLISISYLLMEVFIKTYFLLYVGFILTGFAGSSWTFNYWQRYLTQISAIALEFLTQCILLGVFKVQADSWIGLLTNVNSNLDSLVGAFIQILGVALIFMYLMYTMPRWVGRSLAGEVRLKMADRMTAMSSFMAGKG